MGREEKPCLDHVHRRGRKPGLSDITTLAPERYRTKRRSATGRAVMWVNADPGVPNRGPSGGGGGFRAETEVARPNDLHEPVHFVIHFMVS
jgi:hypothetical protein